MKKRELENKYIRFIGNLKILTMQADYNNDIKEGEKYRNIIDMMEKVRMRRHLALLSEQTEESIIYDKIANYIYQNYDGETKAAIKIAEYIDNNIKYEDKGTSQKNDNEDKQIISEDEER